MVLTLTYEAGTFRPLPFYCSELAGISGNMEQMDIGTEEQEESYR